jgi:predicted phosphodiesterase
MKFILTADWHLSRGKPPCRLDDDWITTQKQHVERVVILAKECNLPIFNVGDIYDTPQQSSEVEQIIPLLLTKHNVEMYVLPGNHDLSYNSMEYLTKCSIGTLLCAKNVYNLQDYGDVRFEHRLVFKNEKDMPPNVKAITAQQLLDENPTTKYIFTGDMHHSFIYEYHGRYVVNPGCLNIQKSNMKDYETGVWKVDTERNSFEWIALPDNPEMITEQHNIIKKANCERISSFIEHIKGTEHNTLDFWEMMESKLDAVNNQDIRYSIYKIKEQVC